jgi:hypothetical protein
MSNPTSPTDLLDGYAFVDCLLLDFVLEPHLRDAAVVCEAYFKPRATGPRQRGVLRVRLGGLRAMAMDVHPEFQQDIDRPYGPDTVKANEVITLSLTRSGDGSRLTLRLASDMLSAVVECEQCRVSEEL